MCKKGIPRCCSPFQRCALPSWADTFLPASCHNLFCLESEKGDLLAGVKAVTASSASRILDKLLLLGYFPLICLADMSTLMFVKCFLKIEGRCLNSIKHSHSHILCHSLRKGLNLKAVG